jgi:hypothetical protein
VQRYQSGAADGLTDNQAVAPLMAISKLFGRLTMRVTPPQRSDRPIDGSTRIAPDGTSFAPRSESAEKSAGASKKSVPYRIAAKIDKIWRSTDAGPIPGGGRLTLKHQLLHRSITNEEISDGLKLVADARQMLDKAIEQVSKAEWTPGMKTAAVQCFRCDPKGSTPAQEKEILKTLQKTRNGLTGDVTIKLTDRYPNEAAIGYVNRYVGRRAYSREGKLETIPSLGLPAKHGNIHMIRKWGLTRELPKLAFIHEATHKFAQTIDCKIFSTNNQAGYVEDFRAFAGGLIKIKDVDNLETAHLLKNADSYSHFIRLVVNDAEGKPVPMPAVKPPDPGKEPAKPDDNQGPVSVANGARVPPSDTPAQRGEPE